MPLENCAVTMPLVPTVTPVTLPNGEPLTVWPLTAELAENWVMPLVLPTVPMLKLMVCDAKPLAADQGMVMAIFARGRDWRR